LKNGFAACEPFFTGYAKLSKIMLHHIPANLPADPGIAQA